MTMRTALILALAIASMTNAHAQTYQWKDSSGRTVISDTPPPGQAAKGARTIGEAMPSVEREKTVTEKVNPPQSSAEKDFEFKKRQQENQEKAEREAKEQKAAAEKQKNCERARKNLTALESKITFSSINEKGEREMMSASQREMETERARQLVAEYCN